MKMMTMATADPRGFQIMCDQLDGMFLAQPALSRGEWQSQSQVPAHMATRDLNHVVLEMPIPPDPAPAAVMVNPNLPWAEDHFQERVGGKPLNPPPSSDWWPYKTAGHAGHVNSNREFSHTYPERMWPRLANVGGFSDNGRKIFVPHVGVRFEYGDLEDLVNILKNNSWSRQAYLPIWFPEDLMASNRGQRVPCTLGYHFLRTPSGLDCTYMIRSCDYMRHFRDDVYMAMRLTQWVCAQVNARTTTGKPLSAGKLYMHIMNFHTFVGDDPVLIERSEPGVEVQGGTD